MGSGEEAAGALSDAQRATLHAICDTVVPSLPARPRPGGPLGSQGQRSRRRRWRRPADLGDPGPELRGGLLQLIDAIGDQGITARSLTGVARADPAQHRALGPRGRSRASAALIGMTLFLHYGAPDPQTGQNPNWADVRTTRARSRRRREVPTSRCRSTSPSARGRRSRPTSASSARAPGGGVIAGALAEARPRRWSCSRPAATPTSPTSPSSSCRPTRTCYWRGGPTPTADGNVSSSRRAPRSAAARRSTGPTACARTDWVREQWAREHGLEGVDGPDFDRHLDAVLERVSANDDCSRPQRPAPADARGRRGARLELRRRSSATPTRRRYDPEHGRLHRLRRPVGLASESTDQDLAARRGRERRRDPRALHARERVLVEDGRAAGRRGDLQPTRTNGRSAQVTVRAPRVVVACGSLESPALLLRSRHRRPGRRQAPAPASLHRGVRHLRRRPAGVVGRAAGRRSCDEFADIEDGYGFLIESVAVRARADRLRRTPWHSARRAQGADEPASATACTFIGLLRDRGSGQVDDRRRRRGACLTTRSPTSSTCATRSAAIEAQVRLHDAAGAREIYALAARRCRAGGAATTSRRSSSGVQQIPLRAGGWTAVLRPPDGHAAAWAPTRDDSVAEPVGRAARHHRASGSATRARSRPPRAPTR